MNCFNLPRILLILMLGLTNTLMAISQEVVLRPVKPVVRQNTSPSAKSNVKKNGKQLRKNRSGSEADSGAALTKQGKFAEAVKVYQEALRQRPEDAALHNNLAFAYASLGQYKESIEEYKKAIEYDPTLVDAYYNLGQAYRRLDRNEEMVAAYLQGFSHPEALKRDWAWTAALELGEVSGQLNRWTESVKAYQLALTLKPKDAFAHYFLGEAYLKINEKEQAKVQYNILKGIDADLANRLLQLITK